MLVGIVSGQSDHHRPEAVAQPHAHADAGHPDTGADHPSTADTAADAGADPGADPDADSHADADPNTYADAFFVSHSPETYQVVSAETVAISDPESAECAETAPRLQPWGGP